MGSKEVCNKWMDEWCLWIESFNVDNSERADPVRYKGENGVFQFFKRNAWSNLLRFVSGFVGMPFVWKMQIYLYRQCVFVVQHRLTSKLLNPLHEYQLRAQVLSSSTQFNTHFSDVPNNSYYGWCNVAQLLLDFIGAQRTCQDNEADNIQIRMEFT